MHLFGGERKFIALRAIDERRFFVVVDAEAIEQNAVLGEIAPFEVFAFFLPDTQAFLGFGGIKEGIALKRINGHIGPSSGVIAGRKEFQIIVIERKGTEADRS